MDASFSPPTPRPKLPEAAPRSAFHSASPDGALPAHVPGRRQPPPSPLPPRSPVPPSYTEQAARSSCPRVTGRRAIHPAGASHELSARDLQITKITIWVRRELERINLDVPLAQASAASKLSDSGLVGRGRGVWGSSDGGARTGT